jgi:hypothetical protein
MANKNPKFSNDVIERVLKRKIKEGKEEQKEFYESQKRQEKSVEKFYKNKKPLVFDSESEEEEIPKTRMKTKKVDNSKAIERRQKRDEIFEHDKNLTDKKSIQRVIDHVIKNISEPLPPKPKKRKMTTKVIYTPEPVKKKRGRPSIPQEEKDKKKLEKAQKAKEEKERKQEEKEYAEREKLRKESGKIYAEKQYKENKIEYKKLKRYMREENETGGNDKRTVNKYNDLKRRIKEYEDKYINNVV